MRVLFLADPFLPIPPRHYGGIERIIASVIRSAHAHGHEIMLLAHPDSELPGVCLRRLKGGGAPTTKDDLANISRVKVAGLKFRPDLIHSFARLAYLVPLLASRVPKIMAFHREPTPWTVRWAARLGGDALTFTGCSDFITRRGEFHGGRWLTLRNGIDLTPYAFQPQVLPDAPLVFLSRVERVKGAHHAIAAARVAGRKLILAGNRADAGPEADYWKSEIAPHLGRDGISYVGAVDDEQKNELLGRAAALVVPIDWEEPFGMVFAEALACGTPVISMRRGALPEIVEHGRQGFLCENFSELSRAIARLSSISRIACRQKAVESLSSELMGRRHEFLYKTLDGANVNGGKHVREGEEW